MTIPTQMSLHGFIATAPEVCADLVMFDRTAERAYPRFRPGDQIVASGYIHEYELERPGSPSQIREQFVARQIGHDCSWTRYVVDRAPAKQPVPPTNEMSVVNEPAPSISL